MEKTTNASKTETKRINPNVAFVSEYKNISYESAKDEMDYIKKEFGIIYKEYIAGNIWKYKSFAKKHQAIKKILEKDVKYLQEICDDTGWSMEEAREKAEYAKKKFNLSFRQYSRYRFFACTDEQIAARMEVWNANTKKYSEIVMNESGWDYNTVRRHMRRYFALYGIAEANYVAYRAWELDDEKMDSYARQQISEKLWPKYNVKSDTRVLADKLRFDQVYKDYIGRKFWINRDSTYEEFVDFLDGVETIFIKPIEAGGGNGAEKIKVAGDTKALYENLMSRERVLVEECIVQHKAISEISPNSVNTIRVVALQDDNGVHILCTNMRFGIHEAVDNLSQGGVVADIDTATGVIVTDAVDGKGNVYLTHPVTDKQFKGFKVPNWDKVIKTATDAMGVLDGINYVGWDIAVCEDKAVIVEGNTMPDLELVQLPYAKVKKGMKYLFDPYLK